MKFFKSIIYLVLFFWAFQLYAQIETVFLPAGEFVQGCTGEQKPDCGGDEFPIHAVKLDAYYIGKYEVQQGQWENIMGDNPSGNNGCGVDCPVENIDWYSMIIFCNELTLSIAEMTSDDLVYYKDEALTEPWSLNDYNGNGDTSGGDVFYATPKKGYRLPTESEWEYAARGGAQSGKYRFSGSNNIDEVAWYTVNSDNSTHTSGMKGPNELSIYDMTGNVWERVQDFKGDYSEEHVCNPKGPESDTEKIYRGGSYTYDQSNCRIADRYFNKPTRASTNIGFRVARSHMEE